MLKFKSEFSRLNSFFNFSKQNPYKLWWKRQ